MSERLNHNPDVLSCLANLSNDEVLTPPEVANAMLDMLPQELFSDPNAKFLDPACKSGIFLREIAKRLLHGLKEIIPDRQKRVDHIFHKQLYGIAITELTSLLCRRSLYCSKHANSIYSVASFEEPEGNILFNRVEHSWDSNGKCVHCGVSIERFNRGTELETYAYEFIHLRNIEEFNKMKFDLVISNPPYQLNTSGDDNGPQAKPIYHLFVQQAMKLCPRFVVMITPSRWFSGGWGLDAYRNRMMSENHIKIIHDYQNSSDCFSGVEIKGGVSYFLWDRDYKGKCRFISHSAESITSVSDRYLTEEGCEIIIRYNQLINIYHKVRAKGDFIPFSRIVSGRSPFGLNTNHYGSQQKKNATDINYFERKGFSYMEKSKITKNRDAINKYKLFIAKTAEDGKLPGKVIGNITDGNPGTICSGTYLLVGPFETAEHMNNVKAYMQTKFFRALVSINKITQNAYSKVYEAVPIQDFRKTYNDLDLYKKYDLSDEEIEFIESMIRPMDLGGSDE